IEFVTQFFKSVLNQFGAADFGLLAVIDLAAFGTVCVAALFGCVFSERLRARDKRVFLSVVNAFTAVTLAVFLTEFSLSQSVAVSAVLWCAGYLVYGALNLFRPKKRDNAADRSVPLSNVPVMQPRPQRAVQPVQNAAVPPVNSVVRLEHALSIADKLLMKNLGRGDRQELEKIKTALTVLKVKGVLSPQEGEALNDMFNALLKLMAKYDL
ncbi:MAG: hypothetical protein K2J54_05905, partial [Clostridia bacterium]|nr:hypothetical protein [Clostridia bacterium]